jgi:excisionase family DNA binding protein
VKVTQNVVGSARKEGAVPDEISGAPFQAGFAMGQYSSPFRMGDMSFPNLYTPEEVAERLRVSRRAVYQWLTMGKLVGMKAGQGWRITEDALTDFMKRTSNRDSNNKEGG